MLSSQIKKKSAGLAHITIESDAEFSERRGERCRWRQTTEGLGTNLI